LIKKDLSKQDKKDWKDFLENLSSLPNKDNSHNKETNKNKRFKFDFHGYSIEDANKKIYEIIKKCYERDLSEILIVTGKGIHSNTNKDVYVSEEFSKLRNTIPEFIKNNPELNSKIDRIQEADQNLGGSGALLIKLRKATK
tara:strand:+ start:221 stop:643 length:423 start_codon:yes stop_codon:yes gene_type:complete